MEIHTRLVVRVMNRLKVLLDAVKEALEDIGVKWE
jgi:hypothetical protein